MTLRKAILCLGLAAALAAATCSAQSVPLKAGVARVEITPATMMPMAGYPNRTCPAAGGTLNPLNAKVLVLSTGESSVALVTVDLIWFVSDRLRTEVASKLGIPVLLVGSSHTHSGPALGTFGKSDAPQTAAYVGEVERKIFNAIREARDSMFPARLSVGHGSVQLGYNRLVPRENGRSEVLYVNRDAVPYGPVDPEFTLLRVEDESGAVRALLVHYACHAVVLGAMNCKYSADYPGILQQRVEAKMKGVQCMFVQGGAGDTNPILQGRTNDAEQNYATMVRVGELLASAVLRSARQIKPGEPNRHAIQAVSEVLTFTDRRGKNKTYHVGITTVLINHEIAIAAVPGEPMHRLQTAWKANAEVSYPLFWAYTFSAGGEWPGYIPDLRSAAHGGYGAGSSIEVGAGETIIQHHLKNLYSLQGMWQERAAKQ